jgi:hypothetical protein
MYTSPRYPEGKATRGILTLVAFLFVFALRGFGQAPATLTPPQPTLTVSLESGTVEIGDSVQVAIGLTNNSAYLLSGLRLTMDAPEFVQLGQPGAVATNSISLDSLAAWSAQHRGHLLLKVLSRGQVGNFNLLFNLQFQWRTADGMHTGQATLEKPLVIGLFGSDKVVGVPLAFAQFIVPGLFFLFLLRIFRAGGNQELGADDKIIVSVIISVICLFIVDKLARNTGWAWTKQLDPDGTVSIKKLFFLAVSGAVLGAVWAGGVWGRRFWKKRQAKQLEFTGSETNAGLIYKALQLNRGYEGFAWEFTTKSGDVYRAAHYFITDFNYVLLGAFKVDREKLDADTLKKVQRHSKDGHLVQRRKDLLAVVKILGGEASTRVDTRNLVKRTAGGAETDAGKFYILNKDEYRSKTNVMAAKMQLIDLE